MKPDEIVVVEAFITAINKGDANLLANLMTEDHTFIDSTGKIDSGRENMKSGWEQYFQMFPDYRVIVHHILCEGNIVAAFGMVSGTYNGNRGLVPENRIEMPAAWKAIVENGKIKLWQVYADWTEGYKIIEEDRKQG